jgi:hypothetical protein
LKQRRIYRKLRPVAGAPTLAALTALLALAPLTDDAVRDEVARLAPRVAAARRLPFRGPLPARALTSDALRREAAASIGGAATTGQDAILRRLGLLPARGESGALWLDNFTAAALPHYDPLTRRLLVPDAPALDKQELPLAHALAHAITDERFSIRRTLGVAPDGSHQLDGDAERARLALIEGDATLATLSFADPRESFLGRRELAAVTAGLAKAVDDPKAAASASWLAALARFTHVDGLLFVARVRARHPWAAVDTLWKDPPATTEQVLHPEKYDLCEEPVTVEAALLPSLPVLGPPIATDVLGELVIRAWLATSVSPELAERAATGWAGDRAALYRPTPDGGAADAVLLWLTLWDDPADADDFARAATPTSGPALERRGDAVALVFGGGDTAPATAARLLDAWRDQKLARQKADRRARRPPPKPPCARARH